MIYDLHITAVGGGDSSIIDSFLRLSSCEGLAFALNITGLVEAFCIGIPY